MTIEELIKKTKSNQKFDFKKVIKKQYVPYIEKLTECNRIIEATCHKTVDGRKFISINTPARYLMFVMRLVDIYTDIDIAFEGTKATDAYDLLQENGLLSPILDAIPKGEYSEFSTLLDMVLDDFRDNEYSITSMLYNFKESLHISEELVNEIIDKLNAEQ